MEKTETPPMNTINILLTEYNSLRDFKTMMEAKFTYHIETNYRHGQGFYITEREAIKKLTEEIEDLQKSYQNFTDNHYNEIGKLKRMSYLEWKKWRKH